MAGRWIVKSDPDAYGFDDLLKEGDATWDGVKNPLALKHMRSMAAGDEVLVYETGGVKAVVGTARVTRAARPDPKRKDPRLVVVGLAVGGRLYRPVGLAAIKADPVFRDLALVKIPRLSVMPVSERQWLRLLELGS